MFNKDRYSQFFRALTASRFRRNTLATTSANIAAQALLILISPILTRLFLPEHFGVAATASAVVYLLASVSGFRLERFIPNVRSAHTVSRLATLACLAVLAVAGLFIAVVLSVDLGITSMGMATESFAWLIVLGFSARAIISLLEALFVRLGALNSIAISKLTLSLSEAAIALSAGIAQLGVVGLVAAYTLSPLITAGYLIWAACRTDGLHLRRLQRSNPRPALQRLGRFGRSAASLTAVTLVNSLSMNMMVIGLSLGFSLAEVGFFALVRRITLAPVSLISTGLAASFWAQAAEYQKSGKIEVLRRLYLKVTLALAGLALVISIGCLLGAALVVPVFGAAWAPASGIFVAMIPYLVGLTMFSPTNHLVVFEKHALQLWVDGLRIALIATVALLATPLELSLVEAVALMATASFLGHLMLFALHLRVHRNLASPP